MTFQDAVSMGPIWVKYWLMWLLVVAFILPLTLVIWRQTRIAGLIGFIGGILASLGVNAIFNALGYVKLLGLPHIILWTPLVVYMIALLRRGGLPWIAQAIVILITATMALSLIFDTVDVLRYILGERSARM